MKDYFEELRNNPNFHLGLGKLTLAMQEKLNSFYENMLKVILCLLQEIVLSSEGETTNEATTTDNKDNNNNNP